MALYPHSIPIALMTSFRTDIKEPSSIHQWPQQQLLLQCPYQPVLGEPRHFLLPTATHQPNPECSEIPPFLIQQIEYVLENISSARNICKVSFILKKLGNIQEVVGQKSELELLKSNILFARNQLPDCYRIKKMNEYFYFVFDRFRFVDICCTSNNEAKNIREYLIESANLLNRIKSCFDKILIALKNISEVHSFFHTKVLINLCRTLFFLFRVVHEHIIPFGRLVNPLYIINHLNPL